MDAGPLSIKKIFGQDRRHIVPLFQRPYVWEQAKQWEPFWEDIRKLAERLANGEQPRPHFLGAIVLDQMAQPTGHVETRLVIDGQQRLTTLQIFLEAFCDLCGERRAEKYHKALLKLTRNDDPMSEDEEEEFKIWPTNVDQEHFVRVMRCRTTKQLRELYDVGENAVTGHPIADGYLYFHDAISAWLSDEASASSRTDALLQAIRDYVRLVVIDLDKDDDAQLIFETLNARGTPLLPSDLVKNFLFYRAQQKNATVASLYEKYWQPFDTDAKYWRKELGRGHAKRHRIDVFIQHFLTIQTKEEISVAHLYIVFRDYATSGPDAEAILKQLNEYAKVFRSFDDFEVDTREGLFFRRLGAMDMTTAYPFLIEVFRRYQTDRKTLLTILEDLESFLVRRMVCQLNTRSYNKLFLDLLRAIHENADTPTAAVRNLLMSSKSDSGRWPDDNEFSTAWMREPIYLRLQQGRVRLLLEGIEQSLRTGKSEKIVFGETLTIEHLLPREWLPHWPLPTGKDSPEDRANRDAVLQTIGNLTLLTSKLNPSLSNSSWDIKRPAIQTHSLLRLNAELTDRRFDCWDEEAISVRGRDLLASAIGIWPLPSFDTNR